MDEVHCLCAVLGMDFANTVKEVHPSLHGTDSENSTNISDSTLEGLTQTILKLKAEKKTRVLKVISWRRIGPVAFFTLLASVTIWSLCSVARDCRKTTQIVESDGVS